MPISTTQAHRYLLALTAFVLLMGTVFYHYVEKFSWLDAYYFCVITLATIGYGDFVPKTDAGKLFTTFYVFIGVGIITAFITTTLRNRAEKAIEKRQTKAKPKN